MVQGRQPSAVAGDAGVLPGALEEVGIVFRHEAGDVLHPGVARGEVEHLQPGGDGPDALDHPEIRPRSRAEHGEGVVVGAIAQGHVSPDVLVRDRHRGRRAVGHRLGVLPPHTHQRGAPVERGELGRRQVRPVHLGRGPIPGHGDQVGGVLGPEAADAVLGSGGADEVRHEEHGGVAVRDPGGIEAGVLHLEGQPS